MKKALPFEPQKNAFKMIYWRFSLGGVEHPPVSNRVKDNVNSLHFHSYIKLETFSLKNDCSYKILESLVTACGDKLRHLDVEGGNFLQVFNEYKII